MTQKERRIYLIKELLHEHPQYAGVEIPSDGQEQKNLLRSLFNIRMPAAVTPAFLEIQDAYLQEETEKKGITDLADLTPVQDGLYLWRGDITTLRCDAIVNAANSQMLGCFCPCHGCIDNAIHTFSGVQLRAACADLMEMQGHEEETGFDKKRLFYTQGDYGLWQCSKACHDKTYDNEETVRRMAAEQKDMKVPSELIPKCPVCGAPMTMNLRCDDSFVQDEGWYAASERYDDFIRRHKNLHVLFLELGVGANTPVIIKYPFWQMTAKNHKAFYACINYGESFCPREIGKQSICIDEDIGKVIETIGI